MRIGKKDEQLIRFGNFMVYTVRDKFGHAKYMDICAVSRNWKTRIDESTWMFGIIKSIVGMPKEESDRELWSNYVQSVLNVVYQFCICGIPIDTLSDIVNVLEVYSERASKLAKAPTAKEEREIIKKMRKEQKMKDNIREVINETGE